MDLSAGETSYRAKDLAESIIYLSEHRMCLMREFWIKMAEAGFSGVGKA
jgi:hypothetical protein